MIARGDSRIKPVQEYLRQVAVFAVEVPHILQQIFPAEACKTFSQCNQPMD